MLILSGQIVVGRLSASSSYLSTRLLQENRHASAISVYTWGHRCAFSTTSARALYSSPEGSIHHGPPESPPRWLTSQVTTPSDASDAACMAHAPRHRTRARGRIAAYKRRETVSAHRPGLLCQSKSYPVSVLYSIRLSTRGRRKYCIFNLVSRWCAPVRAACSSGQIISLPASHLGALLYEGGDDGRTSLGSSTHRLLMHLTIVSQRAPSCTVLRDATKA
ncbi:hypothetical protein BJ912DRAFT_973337 [Pholiota molesta]|nr:hypothetical protein BJ912DRAFT_973337 [Pholiota molesta]